LHDFHHVVSLEWTSADLAPQVIFAAIPCKLEPRRLLAQPTDSA